MAEVPGEKKHGRDESPETGSAAETPVPGPKESPDGLKLEEKLPDDPAVTALIEQNLRLVLKIANDFMGRGLSWDDLVSEGNRGLVTAARRFDPSRGVQHLQFLVDQTGDPAGDRGAGGDGPGPDRDPGELAADSARGAGADRKTGART